MDFLLYFLFWKYYMIMLATLLVCIAFGYIVLRSCRLEILLDKYVTLFLGATLGIFLLVTICACYFTGFKTVMIGIPVVLLFVLKNIRAQEQGIIATSYLSIRKAIPEIIFVSFLIYAFSYCMVFYHTSLLSTPHPDIVFHSKLSVYLPFIGMESNELEYIFPSTATPQPYHYFEAWMASAIDIVFHENNVYILTLVVFTNLILIIYLGACAITEKILNRRFNWLMSMGCLISIFFIGVSFDFYKGLSLLNTVSVFTRNPFNYSKISVIYICIISAVLLALYKQQRSAVISLLILPLVFISCAPAVLITLIVYFAGRYTILDKNFSMMARSILMVLIVALVIFLVYLYPYIDNRTHNVISVNNNLNIFNLSYFKTFINVCGGTTLQLLTIYSPALLIFLLSKPKSILKDDLWHFLLLCFLIATVSLACWALLHNIPDSVQLFSNFSISFFNIASLIVILYGWTVLEHYKRVIVCVLYIFVIILSIINTVGEIKVFETTSQIESRNAFFNKLKAKFEKINPKGVYFRDKNEYNSVFAKNSKFSTPANFLTLLNDQCHQISLTVFEIPVDINSPLFKVESDLVTSSDFYRFVEKRKEMNLFKSIEQSQLDFINDYKIEYVVASSQAKIPSLILDKVHVEFTEPVTKERIMLLK